MQSLEARLEQRWKAFIQFTVIKILTYAKIANTLFPLFGLSAPYPEPPEINSAEIEQQIHTIPDGPPSGYYRKKELSIEGGETFQSYFKRTFEKVHNGQTKYSKELDDLCSIISFQVRYMQIEELRKEVIRGSRQIEILHQEAKESVKIRLRVENETVKLTFLQDEDYENLKRVQQTNLRDVEDLAENWAKEVKEERKKLEALRKCQKGTEISFNTKKEPENLSLHLENQTLGPEENKSVKISLLAEKESVKLILKYGKETSQPDSQILKDSAQSQNEKLDLDEKKLGKYGETINEPQENLKQEAPGIKNEKISEKEDLELKKEKIEDKETPQKKDTCLEHENQEIRKDEEPQSQKSRDEDQSSPEKTPN